MHRDLAEWDRLLELFHPDATIEVTWFEGRFADFVEGSKKMARSDFKTKHFIASPHLVLNGNRAIAETNAAIIGENAALELGCVAHNRFYDLVERREGVWKILRRQSIYDCGYITSLTGIAGVEKTALEAYPREYAALAFLLEKSGFPVERVFATKGSALERTMKDSAARWLLQEVEDA